jgi:hypothetical protein
LSRLTLENLNERARGYLPPACPRVGEVWLRFRRNGAPCRPVRKTISRRRGDDRRQRHSDDRHRMTRCHASLQWKRREVRHFHLRYAADAVPPPRPLRFGLRQLWRRRSSPRAAYSRSDAARGRFTPLTPSEPASGGSSCSGCRNGSPGRSNRGPRFEPSW